MSQRDSGYERKPLDLYETPEWVTAALVPHIPDRILHVWEPACGSGKMVKQLRFNGYLVTASDIADDIDFLLQKNTLAIPQDAIITNPPYSLAGEFIDHALNLMAPTGFVAMLLRCDYDSAKSRDHFFGGAWLFAKKIVLTKRIRWFEDSKGSPSFNHAWYIWDWQHAGAPTLAYAP